MYLNWALWWQIMIMLGWIGFIVAFIKSIDRG